MAFAPRLEECDPDHLLQLARRSAITDSSYRCYRLAMNSEMLMLQPSGWVQQIYEN